MRKLAFVILAVFGLVSVSFGAWIPDENKENYQKLKAEIEEYGDVGKCKWDENGKRIISKDVDGRVDGRVCEFQNIIAFFDEIRESKEDGFYEAVRKVREMPRFKNDGGIYHLTRTAGNLKGFWEYVWNNWESAKNKMEMDGARRGYWKKLAE